MNSSVDKSKQSKHAQQARVELQQLLAEKQVAYLDENLVLRTWDKYHPEMLEITSFISSNPHLFNGELFGKKPHIVEASKDEVQTVLSEIFYQDDTGLKTDETQIANRTQALLTKAVSLGVSDIHLRITDRTLFFGRVDGSLTNIMSPQDRSYGINMISYIFMRLARTSWNERGDYDGRFDMVVNKKDEGEVKISWRISQMPSTLGPKVTIRNLDNSDVGESLEALGIPPMTAKEVRRMFNAEDGLFILSGPTGSGKTTTINTELDNVAKKGDRIIQTLEDPAEWSSARPTMIQTEVLPSQRVSEDSDKFKDFVYFGKKVLRNDTDVVFVGETRDLEVAMIALRMGGTGQVCITTTHTNSAMDSVNTFIEQFGVNPAMLAAPGLLKGLAHQRLVKRVCNKCSLGYADIKKRASEGDAHYEHALQRANYYLFDGSLSKDQQDKAIGQVRFANVEGCASCNKGERGRTALFELIIVDDEDRKYIAKNDMNGWKELLERKGMPTIYTHARAKFLEGLCDITSLERVLSGLVEKDTRESYKAMGGLDF